MLPSTMMQSVQIQTPDLKPDVLLWRHQSYQVIRREAFSVVWGWEEMECVYVNWCARNKIYGTLNPTYNDGRIIRLGDIVSLPQEVIEEFSLASNFRAVVVSVRLDCGNFFSVYCKQINKKDAIMLRLASEEICLDVFLTAARRAGENA